MDRIKNSRAASFTVVAAVYLLATALGVFLYIKLPGEMWSRLLIADVCATVFTYIFSLIFSNASMYDPYWSVQPMIITAGFAAVSRPCVAGALVLVAIFIWGMRLTINWIYTFKGFGEYEDWRYRMLREKSGRFYQFVNFTGIHMVPTLIVYLCTLPAVYIITERPEANIWSWVFFILALLCPVLQLTADLQMHSFRKESRGRLCRKGLWKYARHPNYLGEISMWWMIALSAVCTTGHVWLIAGAVANTVLFLAASIPMADRHLSSREGYDEYRKETRMLLPVRKPLFGGKGQ